MQLVILSLASFDPSNPNAAHTKTSLAALQLKPAHPKLYVRERNFSAPLAASVPNSRRKPERKPNRIPLCIILNSNYITFYPEILSLCSVRVCAQSFVIHSISYV